MRPLPSVLIALALVLTATSVALLLAGPRPSSAPDASAPPVRVSSSPRGPVASPPVASAAGAAGLRTAAAPAPARGRLARLSLAEAIKELDLIKPAKIKAAEAFTVDTPGGDKFRLADQKGKVVIVNFWATWCPPCLEEMPAMERLYRAHKDAGFVLLAVSVDADPRKVTPFVGEHKLTMPIGVDPKMDLANSYGVRALPSSFVVGRDGNLAALAIGPRHWDNEAAHALIEGMLR